jgi:spore coat polysaccharide biosynthesis predicted glycosyltransferase SpsG/RimJ/RimL family protein N-acetyltransferase
MRLAVRVDAGPAIGLGHAVRMLALVQAARDAGCSTTVITTGLPDGIAGRLLTEGAVITRIAADAGSAGDAAITARLARDADWLVLDGYAFGPTCFDDLRRHGAPLLLAVDDCGHTAGATTLDALLNPNLHAAPALHPGLPGSCRALLGAGFALLRRDFAGRRGAAPASDRARHILLSCGGSDPAGLTPLLAAALARLPGDWRATVVVGGAHPRGARAAGDLRDPRFTVRVDVEDMAGLMATCDAAVIAAGSTALELACIGVPMAVVATVANQEPVARALATADAALDCGPLPLDGGRLAEVLTTLLTDGARRDHLRRQAAALADGAGAARVLATMAAMALRLRHADHTDAERIFAWANDPGTRRWSFSSAPIPWNDHLAWMERRLADPCGALLLAEDGEGRPVGTSRLAWDGDEAEISLTVAPDRRGGGMGTRLIAATCRWAWAHHACRRIRARIRPDNGASARAFLRCGFVAAGTTTAPDGSTCDTCILERPDHA